MFKKGDLVVCTESECARVYTVGRYYVINFFRVDTGGIYLADNFGSVNHVNGAKFKLAHPIGGNYYSVTYSKYVQGKSHRYTYNDVVMKEEELKEMLCDVSENKYMIHKAELLLAARGI